MPPLVFANDNDAPTIVERFKDAAGVALIALLLGIPLLTFSVRRWRELSAARQLEALGYEAMGECGIARRRYFRKGGDERTHQIHAFLQGDDHVHRHLAFRDYLRTHPAVCREYAELKQAVAASCQHDIERYCAGKNAFVKEHEANALRWLAGQEPAL